MTVTKKLKTVALKLPSPKSVKHVASSPISPKLMLDKKAATKAKDTAKKSMTVISAKGRTVTIATKRKSKRVADEEEDDDELVAVGGPHFHSTSTAAAKTKTKDQTKRKETTPAKKVVVYVAKPAPTKLKMNQKSQKEAPAPPVRKPAAKSEKASTVKSVASHKDKDKILTAKVSSSKTLKTYKGNAAATLVTSAKADVAAKAAIKQLLEESPVVPSSRKRVRMADKEEFVIKPKLKKVAAAPHTLNARFQGSEASVRVKSEPSELIIVVAQQQEPSSSAVKARKKLRTSANGAALREVFSDRDDDSGDNSSVSISQARKRVKTKGRLTNLLTPLLGVQC